jgi:hypothetical protein
LTICDHCGGPDGGEQEHDSDDREPDQALEREATMITISQITAAAMKQQRDG